MKLTIDNKIEIALSGDKSLRALGEQFGVHHSSIDDLRKDSKKLLKAHFGAKTAGRPKLVISEDSKELKRVKAENEQLKKERVLAMAKAEYAELKLKHERERNDEERHKKHLKKKEKEEVVVLVEKYLNEFDLVRRIEVLAVFGFDHSSYLKFQQGIRERKIRESSIPDEDILAAIMQIVLLPFLGGRKGVLKLLNDQQAYLGEGLYSEIKQLLKGFSEDTYWDRKKAQLEKNMIDRALKDEFEKVHVQELHEVWAIDYTCFDLLGIRFSICVVYEIYSQAYLAITPGLGETTELAKQAVAEAVEFAGTVPKNYLLSDNGVQFCSDDFNKALDDSKIAERKTPPGQPWYNGALESGNRDLKRALYTIALYHVCKESSLTKANVDIDRVFGLVGSCCSKAFTMINEMLPRVKFGVTPSDVIEGKRVDVLKKQNEYKRKKKEEREARKEKIKNTPASLRKTTEQRVKSMWSKLAKGYSDDKIFAIRELLHGRYNAIKN